MTQLKLGNTSFTLAPDIGHCIILAADGVDLLGVNGEAELQKMIASPVEFLKILEVLIRAEADGDDQFAMPQLASFMKAGKWVECRTEVLGSFRTFFLENGFPQLASALDHYRSAAETVTNEVAKSLNGGAMAKKIKKAVAEAVKELTSGN